MSVSSLGSTAPLAAPPAARGPAGPDAVSLVYSIDTSPPRRVRITFHGLVILPSPLVSSTWPHQPTAFCSSWVSSYTLVSIQPKMGPVSSLKYRVSFESLSNCKWCVEKHVSINVNSRVFGSKNEACRPLLLSGNQAAYLLFGSLHQPGSLLPRIFDVIQTRPLLSIMGLCGSAGS